MQPPVQQYKHRAVNSPVHSGQDQLEATAFSGSNLSRRAAQHYFSKTRLAMLLSVAIVSIGLSSSNAFADVRAQISAREAYVGSPLQLYVQISGADGQQVPQIPEVDGLDIRRTGAPSRSSQVTIINGRRSEFTSVTHSYQIIPRREGTFEIPSLKIKTAAGIERTRSLRFAATNSETGDLMFAEIEGKGEKAFVGQPIDSKLKIWIKPFADRDSGIKLSPNQMWQLMSEQTIWGGFQSTLEEMAQNRQPVRGREVLRKDGDGIERAYYLYEIDATIYPKSAGVVDSDDLQIVYQYPLAIGKSRDPFDSFFEGSSFGRSSLASRFFGGGSPFGGSLTITKARPIVVEPGVSDIEIAPIPTEGRPADYRGAVGQYAIVTQASPTHVKAGDPITLQIGIRGTGPMELVQAPPLHTFSTLTSDFKVADESLAGVVQDDIKVFSTTIRPRSENVTQIPAIPFSFFDPNSEQFVTVNSKPISIQVAEAETLALDSIVGQGKDDSNADSQQQKVAAKSFRLENTNSESLLSSATTLTPRSFWWLTLIPPGIWGIATIWNRRCDFSTVTVGRYLREIKSTQSPSTLAEVVQRVLQTSCGTDGMTHSLQRTIPNNYSSSLKNKITEFYVGCDQATYTGQGHSLASLKKQAEAIVRTIPQNKSDQWQIPSLRNSVPALASCGLAAAVIGAAVFTYIQTAEPSHVVSVAAPPTALISLDQQQQNELLEEASNAYQKAQSLASSDVAESKLAFESASKKYQLLADSGIRSSQLYANLGNAYLQQGDLGMAIASYETAKRVDPTNIDVKHNLNLARQQIENHPTASESVSGNLLADVSHKAIAGIPHWSIWTLFGLGWFAFWTVAVSNQLKWSMPQRLNRAALGISVATILIGCSLIVVQDRTFEVLNTPIAVVTDMDANVRTGCGEEFQVANGIKVTPGSTLRVLQQRGDWCQVKAPTGSTGWIQISAVELVANT